MNFLIVLSELLSGTGATLLFIFLLLSEKVRRELALMYLTNPKPKQEYLGTISKAWKINNCVILALFLIIAGSQFAVKYNEVQHKVDEPIVVETAVKMNEQVFYYCLDSAKGKDGLKAAEIKACKEAASMEMTTTEDKVKYTLSKRDIVF